MKRMFSKKSHSWWWDSHISPKNSKWLAENLEEMDRLVKEMLKLIEEEGDSFAKKAEMYYQRRPELISHVEDFYCMYRALAERYDHVTGELRKTIPSELCTQGSGSGSDLSSELHSPSLLPSPECTPECKLTRPKPSRRAAGFDFFLSSGGSSDLSKKGSDGSSYSESDCESDDSKEIIVEDLSSGVHQRILDLENELRDVKEKLAQYESGSNGRCEHLETKDHADLGSKILALEQELSIVNEKLSAKEVEIANLKQKHEDNVSSEAAYSKLGLEWKHVSEFEERISLLEAELLEHKQETEDVKAVIASTNKQYEAEILNRDQAIDDYKRELASASEKHLQEKSRLEADAASLEGAIQELKVEVKMISEEKSQLEARVLEQQNVAQELKATAASSAERFFQENSALEAKILGLSQSHAFLEVKLRALEDETRCLEVEKAELNQKHEDIKLKFEMLTSERDDLSGKVSVLVDDIKSREGRIYQMDGHLHQLHLEHAKLITEIEEAKRAGTELNERVKELEDEVDRQKIMIMDVAEGKREAIRQLCFSLEHYRDGYHRLRHVLLGHKRLAVMAA